MKNMRIPTRQHQGADDGHEPGSAEEGEHLGQLDLIKAIVQGGHTQTYDDAAEGTHLQGGDAQHRGGGALQQVVHPAGQADHGGDARVHHQKGDGSGQRGHFLLLAGHTDGHADGEDQGQVVKNYAAALTQNRENKVRKGAGPHQAQQVVGARVVSLVKELPRPSSSPATGRMAMGSIKDLPPAAARQKTFPSSCNLLTQILPASCSDEKSTNRQLLHFSM